MKKLLLIFLSILTLTACSEAEINSTIKTIEDVAKTTEDVVETGNDLKKSLEEIEKKLTKLESSIGGINKEKTFISTIKKVSDGDTVEIYMEDPETENGKLVTVRILNIDTPEVHGPEASQKFGPEASEYAKKNLLGKEVTVELSEKKDPYDEYGRLLAYIWVGDTLYEEMVVNEGLARVGYLYEPDTKYANRLRDVERKAKLEKKNIWEKEGYVTEDGFDMAVY